MEKKSFSEVSRYYDDIYYKDAGLSDATISRHLRSLASRFVSPGMQVLDVACGTGNFLVASQARGAYPNGVDISRKAIEICRSRMPNGNFHVCIAEELPYEDNLFDLVVCLGSLEHFLEPRKALAEMSRVARSQAHFIILVPNADFLTRRLGIFGGTDQTAVKEDARTLDEWKIMFESVGLEITERWKDLHVLSRQWIFRRGMAHVPLRGLQALLLTTWPLKWQYQVYHLCRKTNRQQRAADA